MRGTFTQQASLTLIVLAVERYLATVHPLTFEGFCSVKVSTNRFILRAKDLYRVLETLKELCEFSTVLVDWAVSSGNENFYNFAKIS